MSKLAKLFEDATLKDKIKSRLPYLFNIAEIENSRAGKIGMEVGTSRERILIALLISKFGEKNVETEIPTTKTQVDVKLFSKPISIKTVTGEGGVKVIWTVDAKKAREFADSYKPSCEILLAQIKWDLTKEALENEVHPGGLFLIPIETQIEILDTMGMNEYLSLPKIGTNPRGVEISKKGLKNLLEHKNTKSIQIVWQHTQIDYNPYKRWVDYWKEVI